MTLRPTSLPDDDVSHNIFPLPIQYIIHHNSLLFLRIIILLKKKSVKLRLQNVRIHKWSGNYSQSRWAPRSKFWVSISFTNQSGFVWVLVVRRELRHYAKNWKVAGSNPDDVTEFSVELILPGESILTEVSTRNFPGGKERPDGT